MAALPQAAVVAAGVLITMLLRAALVEPIPLMDCPAHTAPLPLPAEMEEEEEEEVVVSVLIAAVAVVAAAMWKLLLTERLRPGLLRFQAAPAARAARTQTGPAVWLEREEREASAARAVAEEEEAMPDLTPVARR